MKILDGTGSGNSAKVDENNRLATESLIIDESVAATFDGNAYNINTGDITLTSGNVSGVLYLKNDGNTTIVVTAAFYLLGNSTGGSGDWTADIYRNPTTGTLISSGTAIEPVNRDFGSANVLNATVKKGAEGSTITDGTKAIQSRFSSAGRQVISVGALAIRPGNSIAVTIKPPTSNTSATIQAAFSCYEKQ